MMDTDRDTCVCPARHARWLVTGIRKYLHDPNKVLAGLIERGQTAVDIGCGPGYFTIPMAEMVGESGCVVAVDLQQEMLEILSERAQAAAVENRIRPVRCEADRLGVEAKADFALAFYMVHEAPDPLRLFAEVFDLLKPGGRLLLVEPKFHVSAQAFDKTLAVAREVGLKPIANPRIFGSRSALLLRE